MSVTYHQNSMYRNTPTNRKYLELYQPAIDRLSRNVETVEVTIDQKYHQRPDLMASDRYGDSRLSWLFHIYNRDLIVDPIYDFTTGKTIRVPANVQKSGL